MESFEYATLILTFKKDYVQNNKNNVEVVMEGIITSKTFQSDGKSPAETTEESVKVGKFYTTRYWVGAGDNTGMYIDAVHLTPSGPLELMSPYLAILGGQGWEVVEFKTNGLPAFGEALLKRKIVKD